jgi:ATP-dependent Lon protease
MKLPEHVGVMLLPNAILFPQALLPLHIFEPRYRRMLADCLRTHRMFAVALPRKGRAEETESVVPRLVAGLGIVRVCVRQPDGTSNLMLQGIARVRLSDVVIPNPNVKYPLARIEQLDSRGAAPADSQSRLLAAATRFAELAAQMGNEVPPGLLKAIQSAPSAEHLADLVSFAMLEDPRDKQTLLETLDVPQRLSKLMRLLRLQIRQVELWRKLQGNLPKEEIGHN